VAGTVLTPTLTTAIYPADWTTAGAVTGPVVSGLMTTYADGYQITSQNGSTLKPFLQTTLAALPSPITDPNANVSSPTTTYNLTWGVPDKNGPTDAALFPFASNTLPVALAYAGISVRGQSTAGPTLLQPSQDVLDAWTKGWTGKGVNILLIDSYANKATCTYSNRDCHGIMTMANADFIAPGATKFGLDYHFAGVAFDANGTNLTSSKSINIINMSWGYVSQNSWNCNNGTCTAPTDAVYKAGIAYTATAHAALIRGLNGAVNFPNLKNISNSVITKAAGNDNLSAIYELTTLALSANTNIAGRLLVVGALDKNGTVSSPASKASYSNFAGNNANISDRFVMAYGDMPWGEGDVKINGSNFSFVQGTSFAAPLVAGYAAIVMQKFPNLNAVKTSSIILDTARYDTLACYPNCDRAIYGRGEASLSRALAPVGRLR